MFKKSHKSYDKYFFQRTHTDIYSTYILIYIYIYVRFMPYLLKMRYAFVIRLFFERLAAVTFPRATFYLSPILPPSR